MQADPLVGRQLPGTAYQIREMLGEGGMARVYKAYHTRLQREVALKVILPQSTTSADFRRFFEQEARLVARLHHRNIVTVYDFGESQGMLYLVMQYVAGGTLRNQISNQQPLEPRRAAMYALQMARALHHAHQQGIVHRDVKPLNMLVSTENRNELLLSDFGLARLFDKSADLPFTTGDVNNRTDGQALSRVGSVVGTPLYMAPEQCLDQPTDGRTDIYALGIVLFEMLTGQPPFRADNLLGLLYQHAQVSAPPIQQLNPAVPDSLAQIAARAIAKAPAERYQSAREMARDLEIVLATPAIAPLQPVPATSPRRRRVRGTPFVSLLICVLFFLYFLWQTGIIRWPLTPLTDANTQSPIHSCASVQTNQIARSFTENFQDNRLRWPRDNWNSLTPAMSGNTYTLSISSTSNAFFICPDMAKVGVLPDDFTLTTQITQTKGNPDAFYGLIFHLSENQDMSKPSTYAFIIRGDGNCGLFKYDPREPRGSKPIKALADCPSIHTASSNRLQVTARGNTFTFLINGNTVPFNGPAQSDQSVIDSSYSGGQIGLFVSGNDATYAVTLVQLTTP
jgi:serine/threonine-protein kinase